MKERGGDRHHTRIGEIIKKKRVVSSFLHSTRDKKERIIPKIEKLLFFLSTGTATNG
ncbi:MAG: hypothetical protein ACTSVB_03825 [Candidatus Heimdallarchaeaceae archaeon]